MNKLAAVILIILISCLLGGIYGIIHDQITYSISEEYYTKFKFIQFRMEAMGLGKNIGTDILPEIKVQNPRMCAAIVGFMATWWVGLIIGIILGLVGLKHRDGKTMLSISIKAVVLTICIALVFGALGLAFGKLFLTGTNPNWSLPANLLNPDQFIMVGSMHNFSYLGGLAGLIVAVVYSLKQKKRLFST